MENLKKGKQSFVLAQPPVITAWASIAGKKESEGPLAKHLDLTNQDTYFGQKSWELAEKKMQELGYYDQDGNLIKSYTIHDVDWIQEQMDKAGKEGD